MTDEAPFDGEDADREPAKRRFRRLAQVLQRGDANPGLVRATRAGRELLPGDPRFGDELSTAGERPSQILARHLTEMGATRTSATRELGLTALQLWQAVSESAGRGPRAAGGGGRGARPPAV